MLMILGASFTGLAGWLVMADTGVKPRDNRWASFLHGFAAWLTLQGLVASQGEFSFGVPQFAQVFQPMLVSMAAALGLVAIRLVLGPGRALLLGAIFFATQFADLGGDGPVATRHGATFIVSAIVVELVARVVGVERRGRFAVLSGTGIATIGLAGEWLWNSDIVTEGAPQAWNSSLIAPAVVTSLIGAIGCAVLATGFAGAFRFVEPGRRVATSGLIIGAVLAIAPVLAFLPRHTDDVTAAITLESAASEEFEEAGAIVTVELTPPDAADDAHWFQATAWQGGGLVVADMVEQSPGVWVSEAPVPTEGLWKTMVRLHRNGNQMMAAPIWFPDDPFIGEAEIPAVDRTIAMGSESQYLLRETNEGNNWLSPIVHAYLALTLLGWLAAFAIGVRRIGDDGVAVEETEPRVPVPQRS